jgi:hypothetical protein
VLWGGDSDEDVREERGSSGKVGGNCLYVHEMECVIQVLIQIGMGILCVVLVVVPIRVILKMRQLPSPTRLGRPTWPSRPNSTHPPRPARRRRPTSGVSNLNLKSGRPISPPGMRAACVSARQPCGRRPASLIRSADEPPANGAGAVGASHGSSGGEGHANAVTN